jgi:hypothetical protein
MRWRSPTGRTTRRCLDKAVKQRNERMIGIIPPDVQRKRMRISTAAVIALVVIFLLLFRQVFRSFAGDIASQQATAAQQQANRQRWLRHWKLNWPAYLILLPALSSVLVWQYYPLARGSVMSFQDYKLVAPSTWVGLQNFSHVLFEPRFWRSMFNSTLFMVLSLGSGSGADPAGADAARVPRGRSSSARSTICRRRRRAWRPVPVEAVLRSVRVGFLNKMLACCTMSPQTWLQTEAGDALGGHPRSGEWEAGLHHLPAALKSIRRKYYEAST